MNLDHLASILTATFTAKDTAALQTAVSQLTELSASTEPFLLGLLTLGTVEDRLLRNSALANFKNYLSQALARSTVPQALRLELFTKLTELLVRPDLDLTQKEISAGALLPIISTDHPDSYIAYFSVIASLASENLGGSAAQIQGGLLVSKVILTNFMNHFAITGFLDQLMPTLLQTAENALNKLNEALAIRSLQASEEAVDTLVEWGRTVSTVFDTWDNTSCKLVAQLAKFDGLSSLFQRLLIVKVNLDDESQLLLSFDGLSLSNKLAELKGYIIEILSVLIQHLVETKKQSLEKTCVNESPMVLVGAALPDSPFVSLMEMLIKPLADTLMNLCSHTNAFESEQMQQFVFHSFGLLQKCCSENRFYLAFSSSYRDLVIHSVLPSLSCSADDLACFNDSPEDFVSLGEEICEVQESETVKSRAAALLEGLCEFIDGCLVFCASIFTEMLSLAWDEPNIPTLHQFLGCRVLSSSPTGFTRSPSNETTATSGKLIGIDVALLGLSIISIDVSNRDDIKTELERVVELFFKALESLQSDLLRSRFCMLLKYYSEHLFLYEQTHKFNFLVQYLLNCLESRCLSVALQASTTLNHIMIEEDLAFRVEDIAPEIIDCYASLIPKMHNKSFFESLEEIVVKFPSHTQVLVNQLASSLSSRVLQEVPTSTSLKDSIVLSKSLNVIKALASSIELNVSQMASLEQQLEGLLLLLENPREISFEDDLLSLQATFIKSARSVSAIGWRVFCTLPIVMEKYQGQFLQVFPLLNVYLVFGVNSFAAHPESIMPILGMARTALFVKPNGLDNEGVNNEAALIYQLLLHIFRESLDPYLEGILSDTMQRYSTAKQGFFKARLLGVVLSAFSYNALLTMQILGSTQTSQGFSYLKYVLLEFFANSHCFMQAYDKRVSILGLCSLLMQETLAPEVSESLNDIFTIIINILSQEDNRVQPEALTQLLASIDASDSEEETCSRIAKFTKSQLDKSSNSEEGQANVSLAKMLTPLQQVDEYQHFKAILTSIRKRSPEALVKLVGPLSPEHRTMLEHIVQSERVKISKIPGENTTVRRKAKVKRRVMP